MLNILMALLSMFSCYFLFLASAWLLTESKIPLDLASERAEIVSVVRIVEGAYSSRTVPRCRFEYRSVTLHVY